MINLARGLVLVLIIFAGNSFGKGVAKELEKNTKLVDEIINEWKLGDVSIRVMPGSEVKAMVSNEVLVGSGYIDSVNSVESKPLGELTIDFTLAHELWHLVQYERERISKDSELSVMNECVADSMATFYIASKALHESMSPNLASERTLKYLRQLYDIPAVIFAASSKKAPGLHDLNLRQRRLAILFGLNRAKMDWLQEMPWEEMQKNKMTSSEFVLARRFNYDPLSKPPVYFSEICKHITGVGKGIASKILFFPEVKEIVKTGLVEELIEYSVPIFNTDRKSIRYSIIALGVGRELNSGDAGAYFFTDSNRESAVIAPGAEGVVKFKLFFPIENSSRERFAWVSSSSPEALIYAEYPDELKVPSSCADYLDTDDMNSKINNSLLVIGFEARSDFKAVSGIERFKGNYAINVDGLTNESYISKHEMMLPSAHVALGKFESISLAKEVFQKNVDSFHAGCPITKDVAIDVSDDPEEYAAISSFTVERLTPFSRATLQINNELLNGYRPGFSVSWQIYPIVED